VDRPLDRLRHDFDECLIRAGKQFAHDRTSWLEAMVRRRVPRPSVRLKRPQAFSQRAVEVEWNWQAARLIAAVHA
jgi:hypothetical protein